MTMHIGIDPERITKLSVSLHDDLEKLAKKFCERNFLDLSRQIILSSHLRQHVASYVERNEINDFSRDEALITLSGEPSLFVGLVEPVRRII